MEILASVSVLETIEGSGLRTPGKGAYTGEFEVGIALVVLSHVMVAGKGFGRSDYCATYV
jgi:hypothetical protein